MSEYIQNSEEREPYRHIMFSIMATMFIKYWELDESRYSEMYNAVQDHFVLYGIPSLVIPMTLAELFTHGDKWLGTFEEE